MHRSLVVLLPAFLVLAGCSGTSAPPSSREQEIALLEQQLVTEEAAVPAAAAVVPAEAPPPVVTLVSPEFRTRAMTAGVALSELSRATESEAAFDAALAAARDQVTAARAAVRNQHDRNAAVLLTALLARQKETTFLNLLIRRNGSLQPDPELEAEVSTCAGELHAWLEGSTADLAQLQQGRCLSESLAALAILGQ